MQKKLLPLYKKTLQILVGVILFISTERFCHKQTKGFRPHKITSPLPYNPRFDVEEKQLPADLYNQSYSYIGSGGQSYCFLSADGKTVIKFFKLHHMTTPSLLAHIPLPSGLDTIKKQFILSREKKWERTFTSCMIAYKEMKEETGVLFVHLNPTTTLQKKLTITDKIGISHQIDLDSTPFVWQKRAYPFYKDLKKQIKKGNEATSKKYIDMILSFMDSRSGKQIRDKDSGLKRNFGLCEGSLIEMDIGSFIKKPSLLDPVKREKELRDKTKHLSKILQKHSPSLLTYYEEKIQSMQNTL